MATIDARVTVGHAKAAVTLHKRMAGIVLQETERLHLERVRNEAVLESKRRPPLAP